MTSADTKKEQNPYKRSRAKEPLKNAEDAVIVGGSSNKQLA